MTYAELVAQIQSYTEDEYSTVDINTFITQAENRIFNGVNLPDLRRNDTGVIDFANKIKNRLPSDILLHSLKLQETESSFAQWYEKDQ